MGARENDRRILILGLPGAGKTTLAYELSQRLGIPHVEADHLYWRTPGQARGEREFLDLVAQATSGHSWIFEGHFKLAKSVIAAHVTDVIYLDISLATTVISLWRREIACGWPHALKRDGSVRFFLRRALSLRRMQREAFTQFAKSPHVRTQHLRFRASGLTVS